MPDLVFRTVNDSYNNSGLYSICGIFICEGGCDRGTGYYYYGGYGFAGLPTCRIRVALLIIRFNYSVIFFIGGPRLLSRLIYWGGYGIVCVCGFICGVLSLLPVCNIGLFDIPKGLFYTKTYFIILISRYNIFSLFSI